jgi:hypothetical protein
VLAVVAFFWFRKRRMRLLDQDPERLFENRELIFGPAADRITDAVTFDAGRIEDGEHPTEGGERPPEGGVGAARMDRAGRDGGGAKSRRP